MKKILSLFLILCLASSLCACGATVQDASSANKLVYGEKYIRADTISEPEEQQVYFVFEKDLLINHEYYQYSVNAVCHYTATYKYEIIDEGTLAYFFHSVTFHEDHTVLLMSEEGLRNDNGILLFSENVLYENSEVSNVLYVRESYAEKELPNFGKETN